MMPPPLVAATASQGVKGAGCFNIPREKETYMSNFHVLLVWKYLVYIQCEVVFLAANSIRPFNLFVNKICARCARCSCLSPPLSFASFSLYSLQLIIIIFRGRYWRSAIVWILSGLHGIINTTYVVPYTVLPSSSCTPFSLSLLLLPPSLPTPPRLIFMGSTFVAFNVAWQRFA